MSVKVRIAPLLRQYTAGREIVETTGTTIGECLDNLEAQFPGIKRLYLAFGPPKGLSTPIKDGDEFSLAIPIGGG